MSILCVTIALDEDLKTLKIICCLFPHKLCKRTMSNVVHIEKLRRTSKDFDLESTQISPNYSYYQKNLFCKQQRMKI